MLRASYSLVYRVSQRVLGASQSFEYRQICREVRVVQRRVARLSSQVSSSGVTSALRVTDGSHHGCAVRVETVQVHVASSLSVVLTWWPPNHVHATRLSAEIPVRGFTVDNKSDEALRSNGGSTPHGDGKRVSG